MLFARNYKQLRRLECILGRKFYNFTRPLYELYYNMMFLSHKNPAHKVQYVQLYVVCFFTNTLYLHYYLLLFSTSIVTNK